jgi:hypothetical protein
MIEHIDGALMVGDKNVIGIGGQTALRRDERRGQSPGRKQGAIPRERLDDPQIGIDHIQIVLRIDR